MVSILGKISDKIKLVFLNRKGSPSQSIKQENIGGDAKAINVIQSNHNESVKKKKGTQTRS